MNNDKEVNDFKPFSSSSFSPVEMVKDWGFGLASQLEEVAMMVGVGVWVGPSDLCTQKEMWYKKTKQKHQITQIRKWAEKFIG